MVSLKSNLDTLSEAESTLEAENNKHAKHAEAEPDIGGTYEKNVCSNRLHEIQKLHAKRLIIFYQKEMYIQRMYIQFLLKRNAYAKNVHQSL